MAGLGRRLSASGDSPDTAAVLRFLAANFMRGPVSLHTLLDRGVASLLEENAGQEKGPAAAVRLNAAVEPEVAPDMPEQADNAPQIGSSKAASANSEDFSASHQIEERETGLPEEDKPAVPAVLPDSDLAAFTDGLEPDDDGETPFDPAAAMADDEPLPEDAAAAARQNAEVVAGEEAFPERDQDGSEPETESAVFSRDETEDARSVFPCAPALWRKCWRSRAISGALWIFIMSWPQPRSALKKQPICSSVSAP